MRTQATVGYQQRWRCDRARGITRTASSGPVRGHLHALLEQAPR